MSASTSLTTLTNVKSYLGETGTDHDTLLQALIARVSEAAESFCGRKFGRATVTEYHDGKARSRLVLNRRPVASITSIHDDLNRVFGADALADSDDYTFYEDAGIVQRDSGVFQDGVRNVKVVYVAGYSAVPDDLAHAAVVWVAACFNRGKEGADGLTEETLDEHVARFAATPMPPDVERILEAYKETFA